MLLLDISDDGANPVSAQIINLEDSRTILGLLQPQPMILATSTDANASIESEQASIIAQHDGQSARDIFVGGRLFWRDAVNTRIRRRSVQAPSPGIDFRPFHWHSPSPYTG